jgi:halocin C8-like bacteriocin domain-containing protein
VSGSVKGTSQSREIVYETLDKKSEIRKKFRLVVQSPEYRSLKRYLKKNHGAKLKTDETTVLRVSSVSKSGQRRKLGYSVNIPMETEHEYDTAGIGAQISENSVSVSASRRETTENETTVEIFKNGTDGVDVTTKQTDLSGQSAGNPISTSVTECEACKAVYGALSAVACGVTVSAICAAAGLTTGGAALSVCAAVVPAVCDALGNIDYGTYSAEEVCTGQAVGADGSVNFC